MRPPRRLSLRARLTASALAVAVIALAGLIAAFNLLLDSHLRSDGDSVLRERAAAVLRGLGTVDGRLSVIEAPDRGAIDTQTWIFAGEDPLEQPARSHPAERRRAGELAGARGGFSTVSATDTRLYATPVSQGVSRLGTVVVGASLAPYESTASSALLGSLILGLFVLLTVALLSRWLIGRALRPVAEMTEQAATWSEHDLSRRFFPGDPHDELSALGVVFDRLLSRLAQSLRRERRMTAEISHELRTPLAKIRAESELASSRTRAPEEYRRALTATARHARSLQRVLDALLASARAEAESGDACGDPERATRRALALLDHGTDARGKTVEFRCERPATVAVQDDLLERMLAPLLENAGRYARARITVEIKSHGHEVLIEVRDDGPGLSRGQRELVFEPGFRGEAQSRDRHDGAGLGLALARRLARAAGGEVEAGEARAGASFTLRLPRA